MKSVFFMVPQAERDLRGPLVAVFDDGAFFLADGLARLPAAVRVRGASAASARSALPALIAAAFLMIDASIAPVSPPLAGRFETQMSGLSAASISSKSPSLLTLRGANSAMSTSPAQSSLCLMRSQLRAPSPPYELPKRPPVRTSTHEPLSL